VGRLHTMTVPQSIRRLARRLSLGLPLRWLSSTRRSLPRSSSPNHFPRRATAQVGARSLCLRQKPLPFLWSRCRCARRSPSCDDKASHSAHRAASPSCGQY
jgi:hypothetical protein